MHKCFTVAVNLQRKINTSNVYFDYSNIVASAVIASRMCVFIVQCVESETKHKNSIYLLFLGSFHGVCQTLFGL